MLRKDEEKHAQCVHCTHVPHVQYILWLLYVCLHRVKLNVLLFALPTEQERQIKGLHYIKLFNKVNYSLEAKDFFWNTCIKIKLKETEDRRKRENED